MNKGISKKDERLLLESYAQAIWPESCLLDEVPYYGWRLARDGIHHGGFYMKYDPINFPKYPINIWHIELNNSVGHKDYHSCSYNWINDSSFTLKKVAAQTDVGNYLLDYPSTIQPNSEVIIQLQQIKEKSMNLKYIPTKIPKKYKNTRKGVALVNAFLSMEAFKEAHDWFRKEEATPQILDIWSKLAISDLHGYFKFRLDNKPGNWRCYCTCGYDSNDNSIVLDTQYVQPIYSYPSTKNYIAYDIINSEYLIFKELQTGTIFQGTSKEIIKYHEELNKIE